MQMKSGLYDFSTEDWHFFFIFTLYFKAVTSQDASASKFPLRPN
jgi:hypothetical protein